MSQEIKNQLKPAILDYFDNRRFYRRSNTNWQSEIIHLLKSENVNYYATDDGRNYLHSISILICFNEKGEIPVPSYYDNTKNRELIQRNFQNRIFVVQIDISDILPVYSIHWFLLNCENSIQGDYLDLQIDAIPVAVLHSFNNIEETFRKSQGIEFLNDEILDMKVNWLHDLLKYELFEFTPTIRELLFGGLDIYNELNL